MPDLTVCLLNWRRPQNLPVIVRALQSQEPRPVIFLWDNGDNAAEPLRLDGVDWIVRSGVNAGCRPRWWMASQAETPWVTSFDDDLFPAHPTVLADAVAYGETLAPDQLLGPYGQVLYPRLPYLARPLLISEPPAETRVDVIKGRCLMIRTATLRDLVRLGDFSGDHGREDDLALCGRLAAGRRLHHRCPCLFRGRLVSLPEGAEAMSADPSHAARREGARRFWRLGTAAGPPQRTPRPQTEVATTVRPGVHRILITYDVQGWAYYWRALALKKYAPPDFEVVLRPWQDAACCAFDLIYNLNTSKTARIRQTLKAKRSKTLLVGAFTVGYEYAPGWVAEHQAAADWTTYISRDAWEKAQQPERSTFLANGVDQDVFRVTMPPEARPHKVLWIGSTSHRRAKGFDTMIAPLAEKLDAAGIAHDFRLTDPLGRKTQRLNQEELAEWYNAGTIYVCGSRSEGGPNPVFEAAACGCTIASTRVGAVPELVQEGVNGTFCEHDPESLFQAVLRCRDNYTAWSAAMLGRIEPFYWSHHAPAFFDLFRRLLAARS